MFNITNKKINTSMISNARSISLLTLNVNESKNKINNKINNEITVTNTQKNKQLKHDTDTYDYDNMNDITNYMKLNKNKKYAFVICGVGDFICIDYFLNFKDIHFIFVSKSSLLLKSILMKTEKYNKNNIRHFAVYFNFDFLLFDNSETFLMPSNEERIFSRLPPIINTKIIKPRVSNPSKFAPAPKHAPNKPHIQMLAAVVSPCTAWVLFSLIMTPADKNPIPVMTPCKIRLMA